MVWILIPLVSPPHPHHTQAYRYKIQWWARDRINIIGLPIWKKRIIEVQSSYLLIEVRKFCKVGTKKSLSSQRKIFLDSVFILLIRKSFIVHELYLSKIRFVEKSPKWGISWAKSIFGNGLSLRFYLCWVKLLIRWVYSIFFWIYSCFLESQDSWGRGHNLGWTSIKLYTLR